MGGLTIVIVNHLRPPGVDVNPSVVRGVWVRHDLTTRYKRLMRLEAAAQKHTHVLTDDRVRLLERHTPELRMRHVETSAPDKFLHQTTLYWSPLKGIGTVYVHILVGAFCSLAFAKLCLSKMPGTTADLVYHRILRFYEALGIAAKAVLTDNARDFAGTPDQHPYNLLLALHDISHPTAKILPPSTASSSA